MGNIPNKIVAFFDFDLDNQGITTLEDYCNKGFTLLPLNTPAIGIALRGKFPNILIDDFLDNEDNIKTRIEASESELNWFQYGKDEFTSDGICWPDFDREAMFWFWRNAFQAHEIARSFLDKDGEQFSFFETKTYKPALYYYQSAIHTPLWKNLLGDKANPIVISRDKNYNNLIPANITFQGYSNEIYQTGPSEIAGKIVFALHPGEFQRFEPIIEELSKSFLRDFAIVLIFQNPQIAKRVSEKFGISVLSPLSTSKINTTLRSQFQRGYYKSLVNSADKPWEKKLLYLKDHFEYYYQVRWPSLANTFNSWLYLWHNFTPKIIILSSLKDGEVQLPGEAARRLAIPTYALPHGGFSTRKHRLFRGLNVLYNFPVVKKTYELSGYNANYLIQCKKVIAENEYSTIPYRAIHNSNSWHLLVLTQPTSMPTSLFTYLNPANQIEILKALEDPPPDIASHVSLKIKPHPGWPDLEIFSNISNKLAKKVLPSNCNLIEVLGDIDLILAVNYSGAALINALIANKPVVFFWTDPLLLNGVDTHSNSSLLLPAGILVKTKDELWQTVKKYFTCTEYAEKLQSLAKILLMSI